MEAIYTWNYTIKDSLTVVHLYHDHITIAIKDQIDGELRFEFEHEYPPELAKIYNFYQHFDRHKIREETHIEYQDDIELHKRIYEFGVESYEETSIQILGLAQQCFHKFFFEGPSTPRLAIDIRRSWKKMIYQALGANSPFKIEDGFPIFDYNKIELQVYTYPFKEGSHPYQLTIEQGWIKVITYSDIDLDPPLEMDLEYSIEEFWSDPSCLSAIFWKDLPRIIKQLATLTNQIPGEAPPA